ncbi:MAG: hypothetical protein WCI94_08475 [Rhodospirillales bacterium]
MPHSTCPACQFVIRTAATYWSDGVRYWSILPHDRARLEATCNHQEKGLGDGINWCPSLRPADPHEPHPRDIFARFQSLGDNCEFGLVQRWAGSDPVDLLRFASFHASAEERLRLTIEALTAGFEGLGAPESVVCELTGDQRPRQYAVWERRWNLLYHPERTEAEIAPDALHAQQVRVLPFRRRKLLEDLEAAHRIFVWKSNATASEDEIVALLACLRRYGPNRLLWVRPAAGAKTPGHVEHAGDGLIHGYVSAFAPYDSAHEADYRSWLAVCMNALILTETQKQ